MSVNATNIISVVDRNSVDYNLFQDLYTPIARDKEYLTKIHNKILNPSLGWGYRVPPEVLIQYDPTKGVSSREEALPNLIIPIDTRDTMPGDSTRISALYNLNKYFSYNLEKHAELIESNNYYPLILNKDGFLSKHRQRLLPSWASSHVIPEWTAEPNPNLTTIFANWLEDKTFIYWKKVNHIYTSTTALKDQVIHSFYNENLWNAFEGNLLNLNESNEVITIDLTYDLGKNLPLRRRNRNCRGYGYSDDSIINLDLNNKNYCLNTNSYGDISYMKNESHLFSSPPTPHSNDELNLFLPELIKRHPKKRIKVIKLPSWRTRSSDLKVEFTTYTKGQFLKRQTSFAPIVYNYKYLDKTLNISNINYFALVSNADPQDIEKKYTSNARIQDFFGKLLWKEGVQLWDPTNAEKLLEKEYSGLTKHSNKLVETLSAKDLKFVLELNLKLKTNPLNSHQNATLIARPKINRKTEQKYTKLSKSINKHYNSIQSVNPGYLQDSFIEMHLAEKKLKKEKANLQKAINECKNQIQITHDSAQFLHKNINLYNVIKKKYTEEFDDAIRKNEYGENGFLDNLAADNIKILHINYTLGNSSSHILNNTKLACDFARHTEAMNRNPLYKIKLVEFLIDRPVKIRVDGNNSKVYAGGPYIVRVSSDTLDIKLAQKHSLFGISQDASRFCVHPHTGTQNLLKNCFNTFSRACLGEAAALIYGAFKENDLKLIILASMTWVSSANASDPWGKRYSWFVRYNSLKSATAIAPADTPELVEEEVTEFLENIFEEEEEEALVASTVEGDLTLIEDLVEEEALTIPAIEDNSVDLEDSATTPSSQSSQLRVTTPMPVHNPIEMTVILDNSTNPPPVEATATIPGWNPQDFTIPQTTYTPVFNNSDYES
jgi:hypothetical protein